MHDVIIKIRIDRIEIHDELDAYGRHKENTEQIFEIRLPAEDIGGLNNTFDFLKGLLDGGSEARSEQAAVRLDPSLSTTRAS